VNQKYTITVMVVILITITALSLTLWNRRDTGIFQKVKKVKFISGPSVHNDALAIQLLNEGKPLLIGGIAVLGDGGYIVRTVCFLQQIGKSSNKTRNIKGWSYFVNQWPGLKQSGLQHFDSTKNEMPTQIALPNYMVYFIAEIDPSLLESDANQHELQEAANYAVTFIHD